MRLADRSEIFPSQPKIDCEIWTHADIVLREEAQPVAADVPRGVARLRLRKTISQKIIGQRVGDVIRTGKNNRRRGVVKRKQAAGKIVIREIHQRAAIFRSKFRSVASMRPGEVAENLVRLADASPGDAKNR